MNWTDIAQVILLGMLAASAGCAVWGQVIVQRRKREEGEG